MVQKYSEKATPPNKQKEKIKKHVWLSGRRKLILSPSSYEESSRNETWNSRKNILPFPEFHASKLRAIWVELSVYDMFRMGGEGHTVVELAVRRGCFNFLFMLFFCWGILNGT